MLKMPTNPNPDRTNCLELPMPLLSPTDDTEDPWQRPDLDHSVAMQQPAD
jgi:hypothetical protein